MTRFAVYAAGAFVTSGQRRDYGARKTVYATSPDPQAARVFFRKQDAEKAAREMGGEIVPLKLWFGPYAVPERPMEDADAPQ